MSYVGLLWACEQLCWIRGIFLSNTLLHFSKLILSLHHRLEIGKLLHALFSGLVDMFLLFCWRRNRLLLLGLLLLLLSHLQMFRMNGVICELMFWVNLGGFTFWWPPCFLLLLRWFLEEIVHSGHVVVVCWLGVLLRWFHQGLLVWLHLQVAAEHRALIQDWILC